MTFDFPVEKIELKIKTSGPCKVVCKFNDEVYDVSAPIEIVGNKIRTHNIMQIDFAKNPIDDSFAVIEYFRINDGDYFDWIKTHDHVIDKDAHPNTEVDTVANNCYFGYQGSTVITINDCQDKLKIAAWTIAKNNFEYVKWPLAGETFRDKNFDNIYCDARFMFVGVGNCKLDKIKDAYQNYTLQQLMYPINLSDSRKHLEDWINSSKRISVHNFDLFKHFTLSTGVIESLQSFINRADRLFLCKKNYEGNGEILEGMDTKVYDLLSDELLPNSSIILEIPCPWYDTNQLLDIIKKAKDLQCKIAVDATWLSVSNENIDLDLLDVDEIYFSMNKGWPVWNLRPAFRWTKEYIHDAQTFNTEICSYPKIPFQVFFMLSKQFNFDYTYDYYIEDADELCETFSLDKTSVLWFTRRKDNLPTTKHIGKHYELEEFVSLVNLLEYKGKYFW